MGAPEQGWMCGRPKNLHQSSIIHVGSWSAKSWSRKACRMRAEISGQVEVFKTGGHKLLTITRWGEVNGTHHDAALRHKERELLPAAIVELVKLDAGDLGSKVRREVVDFGIGEERPRRRVPQGFVAGVDVLERLEGRKAKLGIEEREEALVRVGVALLRCLAPPAQPRVLLPPLCLRGFASRL